MGDCFNENLKEARLAAGMSQKDVAEKIGVAKSTYSLYESGSREPDVSKIRKLAEILGVSGDMLLGIPKNEPSTLAAHFEGESFSDEEIEDIEKYVLFVKSKREN